MQAQDAELRTGMRCRQEGISECTAECRMQQGAERSKSAECSLHGGVRGIQKRVCRVAIQEIMGRDKLHTDHDRDQCPAQTIPGEREETARGRRQADRQSGTEEDNLKDHTYVRRSEATIEGEARQTETQTKTNQPTPRRPGIKD